MLLQLRAENYAVIDRAEVQFGPGLNLLTGETGAGKSILIDALALLLGGKASSEMVRHGAEKAVVACTFEMTPGARKVLEENGIDEDADEVLLRREVTAAGKGRVFVNNQAATVGALRLLAPELALVHSQGETMGAFDAAQQRLLLDRFGRISRDAVETAFAAWTSTREKLRELETSEQDRLRMADLWKFQSAEIGDAGLGAADEDAQLEAERRVLGSAEKLFAASMQIHDLLYEAEHAAESTLGAALKLLDELARYEPRFGEAVQQISAAKAAVEDVDAEVREFAEKTQASPGRLAEIEERLTVLERLKRKYGPGLAHVIEFGKEAAERLAEVENRDALIGELRNKQAAEAAVYRSAAAELTERRREAAGRLGKNAEAEINDLAMRTRFSIEVTPVENEDHWTAHGWDEIEFRIATNAGEPLKPLEEIASGGEMSRVMLALKVTVEQGAKKAESRSGNPLPRTLVFDEIDIGIGGRAAEAVGRKLKTLSGSQQVLCITHLPQIAAFADQHYLITKAERKGRTETGVQLMDREERVTEIARMLSGSQLTETSRNHAAELIRISEQGTGAAGRTPASAVQR